LHSDIRDDAGQTFLIEGKVQKVTYGLQASPWGPIVPRISYVSNRIRHPEVQNEISEKPSYWLLRAIRTRPIARCALCKVAAARALSHLISGSV